MADDVEHLCMSLFAIYISSLVKHVFMSFADFLVGLLKMLSFQCSFSIPETSPLLDIWFINIFSEMQDKFE